ncbi:gag [Symbiodinium pilosum]|uniref:Gag protein n=1 Tax=Symbiodinium pilosum TaxID=2952 RepID=A0A812IUD7_SYMPI|nr:gag [Symbiodinium pilosum]
METAVQSLCDEILMRVLRVRLICCPQGFGSLALLALAQQGQASVPTCAIVGQGYDDPVVTSVNGGTDVADASVCQQKCAQHLNCSVFTYYLEGGGCWLQGSGLVAKAIPNAVVLQLAETEPKPRPGHRPSRELRELCELGSEPGHAGSDLYFAEGTNPRRKHLVRFRCYGCEEACNNYVSVSPAYVASLSLDIDFTCSMLETTTAAGLLWRCLGKSMAYSIL